jgi:hypothetical protein
MATAFAKTTNKAKAASAALAEIARLLARQAVRELAEHPPVANQRTTKPHTSDDRS